MVSRFSRTVSLSASVTAARFLSVSFISACPSGEPMVLARFSLTSFTRSAMRARSAMI